MPIPTPAISADPSPFDLDDDTAYRAWRQRKLSLSHPPAAVEIDDLANLHDDERRSLLRECAQRNVALFRVRRVAADIEQTLQAFGCAMGLLGIDQNLCAEDSGVTAITVKATATDHVYIPYTSRPLGWHTDGYYNAGTQQIRAWLLYCEQPAAEGGANELLDHEIAYIRVRDENPEWIRALMADDAFTIPSNTEGGEQIRPDHAGPVFSITPFDGALHMRYSARQRNVIWKDDRTTQDAAAFLLDLFRRGDDHIFRYRLAAGEGLISNNILHRRDGFRDAPEQGRKRLIYRARYFQRLPRPEE
ncbi:MAG: TauD/TfdA family dioxygenase [Gammaproteobacteria bacterium]|nr:TauD/TfdA family dioxygenase [Gammaproteobacteria bacterium]